MVNCRDCGSDLRGAPIPEEHQELYGGKTHFSRLIGVEYPYGHAQRYDGVSEWMCPDCGARRGRWSEKLLMEGEVELRFGVVL